MSQPAQPPYLPPPRTPPPAIETPGPPKRRRLLMILAIVAVLAVVIVATVVVTLALTGAGESGLSQEVAQRECRTALEREAQRRAANLDPSNGSDVLVSIKRVDLQETYETEAGYVVNGT